VTVIEKPEIDAEQETWRKKSLDYRKLNLGTRMRFAERIMADEEIGIRARLGFVDEAADEKWEKTRKELRSRAEELLREQRKKKTSQNQ
jgi:hypothetical protein